MTDGLLDMHQLADYLGVPFTWVRDKVTAREIPHTRIGKHVRFRPDHVRQIETEGDQPVVLASPGPAKRPGRPSKPPRRPKPKKAKPINPPKRSGHLAAVPTDLGEGGDGGASSASSSNRRMSA